MMSEGQLLRELVNARLTAAAEEIFALFETTIAGYKEELCQLKEENQRKHQLLDSILCPTIKLMRVAADLPPGPDEPEELCIKQEEELPLTQSIVTSIKREESSSPLQQKQTEQQVQTQREDISSEREVKHEYCDNDKDWVNPFTSPECAEFEDYGDHYLQGQIRNNASAPEACALENSGVMSGTDGGAERDKLQYLTIHNDNEGDESTEHKDLVYTRSYSDLQSHMENHTGEIPFNIQTFITMHDLNEHVGVHNSVRSYSCAICSKAFTRSDHLKQHMTVHTHEKTFSCIVCEKPFRKKNNLQLHMRTHTGDKPFSCTVCSKTFAQKSALRRHTRIHTGEKPFHCSVCNKTFLQKSNLNKHTYRVHTNEKPYSCVVCNKTFTIMSDLNRHSRIHPNNKPHSYTG